MSKEKIITIKPKGISQKQWGTFLLEPNITKQQWRSYRVNVEIQAPGLKAVLFHGTRTNDQLAKTTRRSRK